ncbi:MAG: glycosyl hydrolase [Ruminococcus sp.]|nr:glycosyl hydrolase [Ruminococcus sp.]
MINVQQIDNIAEAYLQKLILPSKPHSPLWNRENVFFAKKPKWNYIDSCIIKALTDLYTLSGKRELLDYAESFTGYYVNEYGEIPSMNPLDYNLDNINGGRNLIALNNITGREMYRLAYEKLYNEQLSRQPRLRCGSFYHKAIYPHQVWIDGAYMALPFLAEYGALKKRPELIADVISQLECIRNIIRDPATGLYYHGYDESKMTLWSDDITGLSKNFWLRSMGWLAAGLADMSEIAAKNHEGALFELSSDMLSGLLDALSEYITDEGMLYQLPDKPELEGNYPETSGTLLTAYAMIKAYRLGFGSERNKNDGLRLLSAVTDNFISYNIDGLPVLHNICLVAGLGGAQNRNGSAEYYFSEPIVENDAKGIAPFLMAYTELKRVFHDDLCVSEKLMTEVVCR